MTQSSIDKASSQQKRLLHHLPATTTPSSTSHEGNDSAPSQIPPIKSRLSRRILLVASILGSFLGGGVLGESVGSRIAPQTLAQPSPVILECLGHIEGPRFLDGHTAEGIVDLAPSTIVPYTGTHWELNRMPSGVYTLKSQGVPTRSDVKTSRFLDGRIADGTVGLALDTKHSGTHWEVQLLGDGVYTLKCLGDPDGNRYLDGKTGPGTVGLAPSPEGIFTGTQWGIYIPIIL